MKKLSLILVSFAISLSAYAKTQNYILVDGRGVDEPFINVEKCTR